MVAASQAFQPNCVFVAVIVENVAVAVADIEAMCSKFYSHEACVIALGQLDSITVDGTETTKTVLQAKYLVTNLFRHIYADTSAKELL